MAAEILSATMVVSRGPLRKKRNALSVDQHDSARGVQWSSQRSHLYGGPLQAVQPPTLSHSFEGKGTL